MPNPSEIRPRTARSRLRASAPGATSARAVASLSSQPSPSRFDTDPAIFSHVWPEAAAMRTSGELLRQAARVKCPVLAIHGDYDPSPAEGVRQPLARVLTAPFEFVLLKNCGHTPWLEREMRAELYEILRRELA